MTTIELSPAYVWDCEECGRENFQRAVSVVLDPRDEADADAIRRLYGVEDLADVPPGTVPAAMCAPNRVTCRHCGAEFKASTGGRPIDSDDEG